jgi:pimeloyl-ACP methyl ester carboxylesterase
MDQPTASMNEQVEVFGTSHRLVGVSAAPKDRSREDPGPAVILLNSGLIHRVGPNRLSVRLARNLARLGTVALRFDQSGLGDSEPRRDSMSVVDGVIHDTQVAMSHLEKRYGVKDFVVMGICSGAMVSFATALEDPRVVATALIDPLDFGASHLESPAAQDSAFTRHYWRSVRSKPGAGRKLVRVLTGKSDYRRFLEVAGLQLRGLLSRQSESRVAGDHLASQFEDLAKRGVQVLLVYAEKGSSVDYFELTLADHLDRLRERGRIEVEVIPGADHTFTLLENQDSLVRLVTDWVGSVSE